MPIVLITGAGRGIGLEFARQYAADGWRVTDMGGASAPVTVVDSVRGMRSVIAALDRSRSGCFVDYRGQPLPW